MDAQLKRSLTATIYYAANLGPDDTGDPSYDTPVAKLARVENVSKFHGPNFAPRHGEDVEYFTMIFTETDIPADAKIWLPGLDNTDSALAQRARRRDVMYDIDGNIDHYEFYL